MVVNVTDLDQMIRSYIISIIQANYPTIDTSENSAFDDLFVKPVTEIIRPLIEQVSSIERKSSLEYAEEMTDDELDDVGYNRYFMKRRQGSEGSTLVTLSFANLNLENRAFKLVVPAGITFRTSTGLEFQTQAETVLRPDDIRKGYNPTKLVYEIDVPVFSLGIGSKYNVNAGEIMFCDDKFSANLVGCVNKAPVTNAKDKESNKAFAERIRAFYTSRQLGTEPGYKFFVKEMCNEVKDVYVAGYKNKYMQRDKLKVVDDDGRTKEKHIGGMVDIYIRNSIFDQKKATITMHNNVIVLACDFKSLIDKEHPENSIKVYNLTDSGKTPKIKSATLITKKDFNGKFLDQVKVILDNAEDKSFNPDSVSDMKIVFSYKDDKEKRVDDELYFKIGKTYTEIAAPVISIDGLEEVGGETFTETSNRIKLTQTGEKGTTNEEAFIDIINCDDIPNGSNIIVKYTINETLRKLRVALNMEENRIITADIMAKEAKGVLVNMAFRVKTFNINRYNSETLKSKIKASVVNFFQEYKLGNDVEESDIVSWLYSDESIKGIVDYIELPFQVFYLPKTQDEEIPSDGSQVSKNGVLGISDIEYPILNASKFNVELVP